MDINPLNPGGRENSSNISRKKFFHTLAHELFHLQHFHLIEGSSNWNSVAHWILEGFAHLPYIEFFKQEYSQTPRSYFRFTIGCSRTGKILFGAAS